MFICSKITVKSFGDGSQDIFKDTDVRVFRWLWVTQIASFEFWPREVWFSLQLLDLITALKKIKMYF